MRDALPLLAIGVTALPAVSVAQNSAQAGTDQPVQLVTLSKVTVRGKAEVSATGTLISRDTLQRQQAADMADIFANEPSASVGGGASNAQRVYLRGVDGSNLNISIDGARQGRSLHQHRGNIGGIDPELLKRVEIEAGPSADAGPGALGGSIRFDTVDAQDLLPAGRRAGAIVRGGYASADDAVRGSSTVYGMVGEHAGVIGHSSAVNRDDYRIGGGGAVPNSAGQDRDYLLKLSMLNAGGHSMRLGASRNSNAGLYVFSKVGSDNGYAPATAVPTYQRLARNTYTLDYRYHPAGSALIDWKFNLYANENQLDDISQARSAKSTERGGSVRNMAKLAFAGTQHRLTFGADFIDEEAATTGVMGIAVLGPGRKAAQARNLGFFVQNRMRWDTLLISLGLRHDRYDSEYGPRELKGGKTSPHVSAEADVGRGFSISAGYGEAVRASGIIPVGFLTSIDSKTNFNNGKAFKAETSESREIGLHYQGMDTLTSGDRLSARLNCFDTRIANLIEWAGQGVAYPAYIRNMPEILRTKGWELKTSWSLGRYDTTLGYIRADTTVGGLPLSPARSVGTSLGDRISWDNQWQFLPGVSAGYIMNAVKRLGDVPKGAAPRPGYVLHDIQLTWRPEAAAGMKIGLAIRNLTDKRYTSQSSLDGGGGNILPEPGRDVRATISYQF